MRRARIEALKKRLARIENLLKGGPGSGRRPEYGPLKTSRYGGHVIRENRALGGHDVFGPKDRTGGTPYVASFPMEWQAKVHIDSLKTKAGKK